MKQILIIYFVYSSISKILSFQNLINIKQFPSGYFIFFSSAQFSSVQLGHSVMSDSLWPHEPQHTRLPCPSPTPGAYPNLCALSWWCHPTISSSVIPFSSYPQSFPASGSFQMSQLFTSGGQNISFSFNIYPSNEYQGLIFRMDWLDLLAVQRTLKSPLQHYSSKASILQGTAFFIINCHIHTWVLEEP